jgi:hypothetical protein
MVEEQVLLELLDPYEIFDISGQMANPEAGVSPCSDEVSEHV